MGTYPVPSPTADLGATRVLVVDWAWVGRLNLDLICRKKARLTLRMAGGKTAQRGPTIACSTESRLLGGRTDLLRYTVLRHRLD